MASIRTVSLVVVAALSLAVAGCTPPRPTEPTPAPTPSASPTTPADALIAIGSPAPGGTVRTPIALAGTANTFEAALTVDALDAEGNTLCIRRIMATSGSGTPGTWETTLGIAPPDAPSPVTLRAYELSAADGSVVNLVERDVTVSATRPAIIISSPECGATVAPGTGLVAFGRAFVFEAQFTLELRDSGGVAVVGSPVTAASGTEESAWSATLDVPADLPGGAYDLVAFDNSAKDGSIENEFAIQVLVG